MATPDDGLCVRLREGRRGVGLSQQEVADRLGVSRRAVSEWETAKRRPHAHLPELAALYSVSVSWLLTGAEEAAVELRELRRTVDDLYEFVIQLATKTADDFAAVLALLEPEDAPPEPSASPRKRDRSTPAGSSASEQAPRLHPVAPGQRGRG